MTAACLKGFYKERLLNCKRTQILFNKVENSEFGRYMWFTITHMLDIFSFSAAEYNNTLLTAV